MLAARFWRAAFFFWLPVVDVNVGPDCWRRCSRKWSIGALLVPIGFACWEEAWRRARISSAIRASTGPLLDVGAVDTLGVETVVSTLGDEAGLERETTLGFVAS